jgi:hypothetical protein
MPPPPLEHPEANQGAGEEVSISGSIQHLHPSDEGSIQDPEVTPPPPQQEAGRVTGSGVEDDQSNTIIKK